MPAIGQIVHYVSFGTPGGEYGRECRAAIVTEITPNPATGTQPVGLCVLNPTGQFFNRNVAHDGGAAGGGTGLCGGLDYAGGTWHELGHVPGTRPPRY